MINPIHLLACPGLAWIGSQEKQERDRGHQGTSVKTPVSRVSSNILCSLFRPEDEDKMLSNIQEERPEMFNIISSYQ